MAYGALFPAVGAVYGQGGWTGSGTLIAHNWVLTAGHVGNAVGNSGSVSFGGVQYGFDQVYEDPLWTGDLRTGTDFALLHLTQDVQGIDPMGLYTGYSVGKEVSVVGYGGTGTGIDGWTHTYDIQRRAGTNVVDAVNFTMDGDTFTNVLTMDMDNPDGSTNTYAYLGSNPTPTDLEMCVIFGDSGGGLFVDDGGVMKLAGVTSWVGTVDTDPNHNYGTYGDLSGFSAVAGGAGWIGQVAGVPEPASMLALGFGLAALIRKRR